MGTMAASNSPVIESEDRQTNKARVFRTPETGNTDSAASTTGSTENIAKNSEIIKITRDAQGLARDIIIQPAGYDLSDTQQRLLIDVARALTVVSVVMARTESLSSSFSFGRRERSVAEAESPPNDPRRKRDHYVQRLALIASAAVRESDVPYSRLALEAFKEEFVAMEADMVKNQYLRSLGFAP